MPASVAFQTALLGATGAVAVGRYGFPLHTIGFCVRVCAALYDVLLSFLFLVLVWLSFACVRPGSWAGDGEALNNQAGR